MSKKKIVCSILIIVIVICLSGCNDTTKWKAYLESGYDYSGKSLISEIELRTEKGSKCDLQVQDIDGYKFLGYNTNKMIYTKSDYVGYYKSRINYYVNEDGNVFGFDSKSGNIKDVKSVDGIPVNEILEQDIIQNDDIVTVATKIASDFIDTDDYEVEYTSLVLTNGQDEKAEYREYRYESGLYNPSGNESILEYRATFFKEYEGIRSSDLIQISLGTESQLYRLIVGDLDGYEGKKKIPTKKIVNALIKDKVAKTTKNTGYVNSTRPMLYLNEQDRVIAIVNTEVTEYDRESSEAFIYVISE